MSCIGVSHEFTLSFRLELGSSGFFLAIIGVMADSLLATTECCKIQQHR